MYNWIHDDITWCNKEDCEHKDCFRHLANRKNKEGWFSLAELKNTEYCPYKE